MPPQSYGSLGAEAFAEYPRSVDLQLPHLAEVLGFEQAATATLTDDVPRVVCFAVEPLPLLRALGEGRLPEAPSVASRFEIGLAPDVPAGVATDAARDAFPFH